ncbi:unnamed protein product [Withania somnifera]
MGSSSGSDVEAGFAKLQGEDFEYYMQTYSIILGRNSKKSTVDVDLSSLGGGMNISRHHARIFYDFQRRRFALEVLGKNGCFVEGVLHLPGNPPVKLDSQDLLQIGDKEFYFLLPIRSILGGPIGPRHHLLNVNYPAGSLHHHQQHMPLPPPVGYGGVGKKGLLRGREYYEEEYDDGDGGEAVSGTKKVLRGDVIEAVEHYGNTWHHSRVRRYLTSEDYPSPEAKLKPWYGLLILLRKYPEHFVINTRSKGWVTLEFVSLVSLLS